MIQSVSTTGQSVLQLQDLEAVHRAVQTISVKERSYKDLQEEAFLGEGETFVVKRCRTQGQLVAVMRLKLNLWATNTPKFFCRLQEVLIELPIMCWERLRGYPNILSLLLIFLCRR
ncbi:hypothetical protein K469DRAFT_193770 [Zopfia rhizophila CBS 207.26]|uniref:Uncharacterized protein n=1 Tax=Zopfia rhizophila CBS 207.26 TaxID=1314779 RepID=A0A6A6ETX5_9PEZI|nr:hypothetical protein K469DRAFT_193770 [Zopfia rhizophila CBS 207.26]